MSHSLGIIADGFTGALMVAGYLEGAGIYCPVVFGRTRTRTIPVTDALFELGRMAEAFVSSGYERLAYKACASFDSTEAGNIGPAADYLADLQALRPVLMSAGFPRYGTTVHPTAAGSCRSRSSASTP